MNKFVHHSVSQRLLTVLVILLALQGSLIAQTVTKKAFLNGSTTPATTVGINDTINYVISLNGSSTTATPTITDVMSSNQKYIAGSAVAEGWTLNNASTWFSVNNATSATFSNPTTPTAGQGFVPSLSTNAYLASVNTQPAPASTIAVGGSGDGMEPIYFKTADCQEKVLMISHHQAAVIKCWNLTTNASCDNDIKALTTPYNFAYSTHSSYSATVNNKVYTVNVSNGTNFSASNPNTSGSFQIDCIDLNLAGNPKYCSGYPKAIPGAIGALTNASTLQIQNMDFYDSVTNRIYFSFLSSTANGSYLAYMDLATGSVSTANPFTYTGGMAVSTQKVVPLDGVKLIIEGVTGANCIDVSLWPTLKDCNPANAVGVFTSYGDPLRLTTATEKWGLASPLLNASGNAIGFCVGQTKCYDLNGLAVVKPASYNLIQAGASDYLVYGTKVITLSGYYNNFNTTIGNLSCFDFATNTSCGNTGSNTAAVARSYGMDWRVSGKCFLVYGDDNSLSQWGIEAGGLVQNSTLCSQNACSESYATLPDVGARFCSPEPLTIQYGNLTLSNIPATHSGSTLKVLCNGVVTATFNIPTNATSFTQSLSAIDYNSCKTPQFAISINNRPPGSPAATINIAVNYTNGSRFPEICYKAKINVCDGAALTNTVSVTGYAASTVSSSTSLASSTCFCTTPTAETVTNGTFTTNISSWSTSSGVVQWAGSFWQSIQAEAAFGLFTGTATQTITGLTTASAVTKELTLLLDFFSYDNFGNTTGQANVDVSLNGILYARFNNPTGSGNITVTAFNGASISNFPASATRSVFHRGISIRIPWSASAPNSANLVLSYVSTGSNVDGFMFDNISLKGSAICTLFPLAVTYTNFTATASGSASLLYFEIGNASAAGSVFEIERSSDGNSFIKIGALPGSLSNQYYFTDLSPELNGINYYRIKEIDAMGKVTYSPIRLVKFSEVNNKFQVFPNPTSHELNVLVNSNMITGNEVLELYNTTGQKVFFKKLLVGNEPINVSKLPGGVYYLRIMREGTSLYNTQVTISR